METVAMACDVYEPPEPPVKNPILLIHGLFWNKHMFKDLAESLCWETRRKVFCLDMRCHDQSPFYDKFSVELVAEDIKRFMKDRNLEKVAFVCHSLSCSAAYLVTLDEPEKVEKIVMIDHAPFSDYTDEFYKANVIPQFTAQDRMLNGLDPSLSLTAAKRKILSICAAGTTPGQRLFLHKVAYELTKENGQFKFKTNHKFLIDGYWENCRPKPRGRSDHEILIIRCNDSLRVTDGKFEAALRYNPNAKLVTMNDVTHLLMFEKQEEFLQIVKDFLS